MLLTPPSRILNVMKAVLVDVFDRRVVYIDITEKWMKDTIEFGVNVDEFSCIIYLRAAIRTGLMVLSVMRLMEYSECDLERTEAIQIFMHKVM